MRGNQECAQKRTQRGEHLHLQQAADAATAHGAGTHGAGTHGAGTHGAGTHGAVARGAVARGAVARGAAARGAAARGAAARGSTGRCWSRPFRWRQMRRREQLIGRRQAGSGCGQGRPEGIQLPAC